MADANKIITKLSEQIAILVRDNAILTVENEELRELKTALEAGEKES